MKHTQLILAAALVALAGCSKENIDLTGQNSLDNEIGFTAVTRKATKANDAIITSTTYGTDNSFTVWGWWTEEGDYSEFATTKTSNFMSGLKIEWTKGANKNVAGDTHAFAWRNDAHYYYWPFKGEISFLAVHPEGTTLTTNEINATTGTPVAAISNYAITDANKTTDLMFATNKGSNQAAALPMVFKHALSQILVKVKTDDDYTNDVQFDVNSVKFNNIDKSGTVTFSDGAISWADNTDQTAEWMYYNTTLENISNQYQDFGAALLMVPQDANTKDANANPVDETETTITISYSMQSLPKETSTKLDGTVTIAAPWLTAGATPASIAGWEAGKKYVYTLNFKLNEILFDPSIEADWVVVDVKTIDI